MEQNLTPGILLKRHYISQGKCSYADGFVESVEGGGPNVTVQLTAAAKELQEEQTTLEKSWNDLITLAEKKMIFEAIGLRGPGYSGQGHWYSCRGCGGVYVVTHQLPFMHPHPCSPLNKT